MRRKLPAALLAVVLAFCGFSEGAVLCEESAAHLSRCCPGFAPRFLRCEGPQFPSGCSSVDVDSGEARCLVSRSCAELRDDGTCARALSRWTNDGFATTDNAPVCR